jgi:hypothetical protein
MKQPLYKELAQVIGAYHRTSDLERQNRHAAFARAIANDRLPSGSGLDAGCRLDVQASTAEKLVIRSSYHLLNSGGYYIGWIDFTVVVQPSLAHDIDIRITGPFGRRQDLKDYLAETFDQALRKEYEL